MFGLTSLKEIMIERGTILGHQVHSLSNKAVDDGGWKQRSLNLDDALVPC